jgi:hypothetical protein
VVQFHQIRLLRLHPGTTLDPLVCSLTVSSITSERYRAVSYVWGSSERPHKLTWFHGLTVGNSVTIDDTAHPGQVLITTSLKAVLIHFRQEHTDKTLWIDSVCINQDDIPERGEQVQIMHKYTSSYVGITIGIEI